MCERERERERELALHVKINTPQICTYSRQKRIRVTPSSLGFLEQIMGMSDNVTLALGASGYNVHKLVLFGSFGDVMPWMLR